MSISHPELEPDSSQQLTVAAERTRAVRCPECQTKYMVARKRDRVRCFQCERMLIIGIEAEDMQ